MNITSRTRVQGDARASMHVFLNEKISLCTKADRENRSNRKAFELLQPPSHELCLVRDAAEPHHSFQVTAVESRSLDETNVLLPLRRIRCRYRYFSETLDDLHNAMRHNPVVQIPLWSNGVRGFSCGISNQRTWLLCGDEEEESRSISNIA